MRIAVTGSSGLIGTALVDVLRGDGHEVVRLVRRPARGPGEVRWDPAAGELDASALGRVDAAVNLAGAPTARPWTTSYKKVMLASRVDSTRTLARTLAALEPPPKVLLSGSAIGYYGFAADRPVDETDGAGSGFLPDLCRQWEDATAPADAAGTRVCLLRSALVLSHRGGALAMMLPLFRLGLGGRIGSGTQCWSWVALADEIRAIRFLLTHDQVSGPVNLSSPEPVTNAGFTRALGDALHRPTPVPVPGLPVRLALGDYADQILGSQRVLPTRLQEAGFRFGHPEIHAALDLALTD